MALRDLVVLLDGSPRDATKLAVAVELARRNDAHLTGLCPLELLLPADMSFALGGYPDLWALPEFAKQVDSQARAKAALIEAGFLELLRREGIKGDWVLEPGFLIPSVTRRAQASRPDRRRSVGSRKPVAGHRPDVGRGHPDDRRPALAADPLCRPVRYDRHECSRRLDANTRVCTSGPRCAAILAPSAKVIVLTIETPRESGPNEVPATTEIAEHLSRYELDVSAARTVVSDGLSSADVLLDYASDIGADLLVVGGYGHSRTREMIMGGVTRDLLAAHDGAGADVALTLRRFRATGPGRRRSS